MTTPGGAATRNGPIGLLNELEKLNDDPRHQPIEIEIPTVVAGDGEPTFFNGVFRTTAFIKEHLENPLRTLKTSLGCPPVPRGSWPRT